MTLSHLAGFGCILLFVFLGDVRARTEVDTILICGVSALEVYDLSPSEHGMWALLARQAIAADLNLETGASSTPQVDADLDRAYELLAMFCMSFEDFPDADHEAGEIKNRLDAFNNGHAPGSLPSSGESSMPPSSGKTTKTRQKLTIDDIPTPLDLLKDIIIMYFVTSLVFEAEFIRWTVIICVYAFYIVLVFFAARNNLI
jgi:hypothetical protein